MMEWILMSDIKISKQSNYDGAFKDYLKIVRRAKIQEARAKERVIRDLIDVLKNSNEADNSDRHRGENVFGNIVQILISYFNDTRRADLQISSIASKFTGDRDYTNSNSKEFKDFLKTRDS